MKRYIATLLLLAICASTQAREVFPLNEGWRFFFKSENSSDNARHVTLPHTWDTDTGGTGYFLETTANYQNDMYIPAEWATKRLFVKFYGVQSVADVFVNGYEWSYFYIHSNDFHTWILIQNIWQLHPHKNPPDSSYMPMYYIHNHKDP